MDEFTWKTLTGTGKQKLDKINSKSSQQSRSVDCQLPLILECKTTQTVAEHQWLRELGKLASGCEHNWIPFGELSKF